MILTLEEVKHIAELARLRLTEAELEHYRKQLASILEHVTRLQALDTTGIPPTASVLPSHDALRADEIRPGLTTEQLLRNAPKTEGNQFMVPPVLE